MLLIFEEGMSIVIGERHELRIYLHPYYPINKEITGLRAKEKKKKKWDE